MEITLALQDKDEIAVIYNDKVSHVFDMQKLVIKEEDRLLPYVKDPVSYGQTIYGALFQSGTIIQQMLDSTKERIVLITNNAALNNVPWEYAHGPEGFVSLQRPFIRGLPAQQRITLPVLESSLHIVVAPADPLDENIASLYIEGEWETLQKIIHEIPYTLTLERAYPPTLEQLRRSVAGQRYRVVHFIGHGEQHGGEAMLYFEREDGSLDMVTAQEFMRRMRDSAFLVTLNACMSTTPDATGFSNLAVALVQQGLPYALGMHASVVNEDACAFLYMFYSELARGLSVEDALLQGRITLAKSPRLWCVGVPFLYTALNAPATGWTSVAGSATIREHQPKIEIESLLSVGDDFQGHISELRQLGGLLTGESRPRLLTVYGISGQGKTTLVRRAVERFGYAWPGGVWAISLGNLPSREAFIADLAYSLAIITNVMDMVVHPIELEKQVMNRLSQRRTLLILDDAEVLVEAVQRNDEGALALAHLLRKQLASFPISLLVIAHSPLGWEGEVCCKLGGLTAPQGARLFRRCTLQRMEDVEMEVANLLSQRVDGHPLSLCLLGAAFNASQLSLQDFVARYEKALLDAEDAYVEVDSQQRALYACLGVCLHGLSDDLRTLLCQLSIFHAPFLSEVVASIVEPEPVNPQATLILISNQLQSLWQRGLVTRIVAQVSDETVLLYRLSSLIRFYIDHYLDQEYDRESLFAQFGLVYLGLVTMVFSEIGQRAAIAYIVRLTREDFERGARHVESSIQGYYLLHWASALQELGEVQHALKFAERALEMARDQDRALECQALNRMAVLYQIIGIPQRSLELLNLALPFVQEMGERAGEANVLNNMAGVYRYTGQTHRALELYEQALPILRELDNRSAEAHLLCNMAGLYQEQGQYERALAFYNQALPLIQEVGDQAIEANILQNMAELYQEQKQYERSFTMLNRVLPLYRDMGDQQGEATTLRGLAIVCKALNDLERALDLLGLSLLVYRDIGDRSGEATTLSDLAILYQGLGQPQRAQTLLNQALPLLREMGDRAGEVSTLIALGSIYRATGHSDLALKRYEQAFPLMQELEDQSIECSLLNEMALAYEEMGKLDKTLALLDQVLPIVRKLGRRTEEASILNNMGVIYKSMEQPKHALKLYNQALPIEREIDDKVGEAATLSNIALLYYNEGQSEQALELLDQALPLLREAGSGSAVANALKRKALIYQSIGQLQQALELQEQALLLLQETREDPAERVATLSDMALLLYRYLNLPLEAARRIEQAIAGLVEAGLQRDSNGQTLEDFRHVLAIMRLQASIAQFNVPLACQSEQIVHKTVDVMTQTPSERAAWCDVITEALQIIQQRGGDWQREADFFTAIRFLLNGQTLKLPKNHLYAHLVSLIQNGIAMGKMPAPVELSDEAIQVLEAFIGAKDEEAMCQVLEAWQAIIFQPEVENYLKLMALQRRTAEDLIGTGLLEWHLTVLQSCKAYGIAAAFEHLASAWEDLSLFVEEVLLRRRAACLGEPAEKMLYARYLSEQMAQTADEGKKAFLRILQLHLFGGDLLQLGRSLSGIYCKAWMFLILEVETEGIDAKQFVDLVEKTVEVFGAEQKQLEEWHEQLVYMRDQAKSKGVQQFVLLLEATIWLLDGGTPSAKLGQGLTGVFILTLQEIIEKTSFVRKRG